MRGKTYVSSDWHGCADPALKVLDFLQPNDTLYYLGDAIDRGPEGFKLLQLLLNDPRVIFIKGNHEQIMEQSLPYLCREMEDICYYAGPHLDLWVQNGGTPTIEACWATKKDTTMLREIRKKLEQLPVRKTYHSLVGYTIILEHAGFTPWGSFRQHDPLWDRSHFYDEWNNGFKDNVREIENTYLVHGHTPVQYLQFDYGYRGEPPMTIETAKLKRSFFRGDDMEDWKPQVLRYCDGHKFDIDMCTIASGRIALMDLDTFKVTYFDKE